MTWAPSGTAKNLFGLPRQDEPVTDRAVEIGGGQLGAPLLGQPLDALAAAAVQLPGVDRLADAGHDGRALAGLGLGPGPGLAVGHGPLPGLAHLLGLGLGPRPLPDHLLPRRLGPGPGLPVGRRP